MFEYENFLQDIQPSLYFDFCDFPWHILQLPKHILVTLHLDNANCSNQNDDCILRRLSGDPHVKRFSAILFIWEEVFVGLRALGHSTRLNGCWFISDILLKIALRELQS